MENFQKINNIINWNDIIYNNGFQTWVGKAKSSPYEGSLEVYPALNVKVVGDLSSGKVSYTCEWDELTKPIRVPLTSIYTF